MLRHDNSISAKLLEREAALCKAFAHPTRLHLLTLVSKTARPVALVQERLGISKANLSQHMAILKSAGLVTSSHRKGRMYCALTSPEVAKACKLARKLVNAQLQRDRRLL